MRSSGGLVASSGSGGSSVTDSTGPEVPGLLGHPVGAAGRCNMVSTVSDPPDRISGRARVLGLDVVAVWATAGLGSVLRLAAVDAQVAVTESTTLADVEDRVGNSVNAEVGDLGLATRAAAEGSTSNDSDRTEDVYAKQR